MADDKVKVGIVGLGDWAKVLTRAALESDKLAIVAATSRSQEKRDAFAREFGIAILSDLPALLAEPGLAGVIIATSNDQHLPVAESVARAGKHIYVEKPIADTLSNGLKLAALQERYDVKVMVGHSARLLKGTRLMRAAIDADELGKVTLIEGNFSTPRALSLTPNDWRWYADKSPGGPLTQLAIHQFDTMHYLGGPIAAVASIAAKRSPVGAEVDDQSLTLIKFADGKLGYVGASWTSPGTYYVRVYGQRGLMHYELDQARWGNSGLSHETSTLYIQRGKAGYGQREEIALPPGNMFRDEIDLFADMCRGGPAGELSAQDGIIALAMVEAALRSTAQGSALVAIADMIEEARASRA